MSLLTFLYHLRYLIYIVFTIFIIFLKILVSEIICKHLGYVCVSWQLFSEPKVMVSFKTAVVFMPYVQYLWKAVKIL